MAGGDTLFRFPASENQDAFHKLGQNAENGSGEYLRV